MVSYKVGNERRRFRKLDTARRYAIRMVMKNPYYGKANVSAPITDDKNRFVGDVYVDGWKEPRPRWVTHYWKINESTGKRVMLSKTWLLNMKGELKERIG